MDFVPLALISRSDLIFRSEVKLLLQKVNVDISELLCADDVPLLALREKEHLRLTLVDHNLLDPRFEKLSSCVEEISDHHTENNQYPWVTGGKRNVAFDSTTGKAMVGSTCTLVSEKFADMLHLEPDVATLLQGVIALDTINMDANAGIGTARDAEALRRLREISQCDQTELFETLRGAKLDPAFWRDLTVAEVMRIDYKSFHSPEMKERGIPEIGIATALQPVRDCLSKDALAATLRETIRWNNLSVLAVMTFVHQPAPRRELVICTHDRRMYDHMLNFLLDGTKHDLQCALLSAEHAAAQRLCGVAEEDDSAQPLHIAVLVQNNAKASRKQVAPLLLHFFESYFPDP
jgi:exopolyphosphatase